MLMLFNSRILLAAPERVSDFAMLDTVGEFHQLSRYQHREALVMMSFDADCSTMDDHITRLQAIQEKWQDQGEKGIEFVLLDSKGIGRNAASGLATPNSLPLLEDTGQLVSASLAIKQAGEVLVLDPFRTTLLFRGMAGAELEQTLAKFLAGNLQETAVTSLHSCPLNYLDRDRHLENSPDYATEVAPIIIDHCTECHRPDGVGPFAMDSHLMLLGWSPMIREVLLNRRMPPTQVDPYIGHSKDARYISTKELQTLVHWIDAGAPRGDSKIDPLEQLDFKNRRQWLLGQPDYIVKGPEIAVASTGVLDYDYHTVELPFTEDRWVRAVQYLAGDESVLHHLMTFVVPPEEDFWGPERQQETATRRFLEGYAPGRITAVEFPPDTGVLIPAGYRLAMQFHYVTSGRSTLDQTMLGLYFHDLPPPYEKLTQVVASHFTVPAGDNNFELTASHHFDNEVVIVGVRAHMHFRGKKMKFNAILPNGENLTLFSVPAYNYGWQPHYLFTDPVTLPADTRIEIVGALDNSMSNPANPNPDADVPFGIYSWEEMFTGYWSYYMPNATGSH
ncbi:MAG: hypothetical protein OXE78_08720 [Gammaproteobacteria bacterium]|nr:hypothetical protein [Gammaproteobacteria bacterium]MCY4356491.1 hypothetical protein [Gammaproteobacteria bacterium]